MMKRFFNLILTGALLALCAGCEIIKKDVPEPEEALLALTPNELIFEAAGGSKTFAISCNGTWKLENGCAWCKTDFSFGALNQKITVTVEAHTGIDDRNVNLVVTSGDKTAVLAVTQKGKDAIILGKDKYEVAQEGGKVSVGVKSNIAYTVTIPAAFSSWISLAPASRAVRDTTYDFAVAANDSADMRSGYIVFGGNSLKDTVYVYQAQQDRLILSQDTCAVEAAGDTLTVELRTNINYEVVIPDSVKWVKRIQPETRAMRTDRLTFLVKANGSSDDRETAIVVKDQNSDLADTLRILQAGKDALMLGEDEIEVASEGGNIAVEVRANVEYDFILPEAGWVKQKQPATRAVTAKTYRFTVAANESEEERKAVVVVKARAGNLSDTLHIRQAGIPTDERDITAKFDPDFAKVLQEKGYIPNASRILFADVKNIKTLNVRGASVENYMAGKGLTSLKGIEYFESLTTLYCYWNQLTSLDVSKNTALTDLHCSSNQLTSLDVSKNTALTNLNCNSNQLTSLDVSQNTALRILSCEYNQLTSLDVSKNTALIALYCSSNPFTSLDVSQNTALTTLVCNYNQLTSLDVSKNTALTNLQCSQNKLTSLDVSQNTKLTSLFCHDNQLASLDVSKNTALTTLYCNNNQLSSLTVNKALVSLACGNNSFTSLDVSSTDLTSLSVSRCTALTQLYCSNSRITSLNLNGCSALTYLDCSNSRLASLDVSGNSSLQELKCAGNPGNRSVFSLRVWQEENHTLSVDNEWSIDGGTVRLVREGEQVANIGTGKTHGEIFTETVSGVEFKMVYVKGGTFMMGATEEQGSDAAYYEKPAHEVTLSDYYIGECEVTQGLWKAVMGSNPSLFKGDDYPVQYAYWNDIQTFLTKLNEKTGKKYALPTEAEWEYAARGGWKSARYKYSGSNNIDDVAWYGEENTGSPHPVKQKQPNELGLYDMSGNVAEVCCDWYSSYSSSAQIDPVGSSGFYHVARGGSFSHNASICRVSYRMESISDGYGFRVVLLP